MTSEPADFLIRPAVAADRNAWARMRHELWPDADAGDARGEIERLLAGDGCQLLATDLAHAAIGFAEASIRRDYVNGCETSPVAFLEGIYVRAPWRHKGVGRTLVEALQNWAGGRGLREFASDAHVENAESLRFHGALGFEQTERVIYFRKVLA